MAILKYEGFDHEAGAADLYAGIISTLIVNGVNQTANLSLSGTTQFGTGACLGVTATNPTNGAANAYAVTPIAPASNTVIIGAAISLSASITNGAVFGLVNNYLGQVYCYIGAGGVSVYRGDPTTGVPVQIARTVNSVVASLGWAYVEMKVVVASGTAGSVQVQVNGTTVLNQANINTSNDGTTGANGILMGTVNTTMASSGFTIYFDDVYANDATGPAPYNTFLGPVRVVTQFPSANGSTTNFAAIAHHPNWQNVSDTAMDADGSYNYSSTTGNIDTFVAGTLPANTSAVFAVKITAAGRIDDSGLRTVQTYLKSGKSITTGASTNLVGSYQYFSDIYVNDPNTAAAWTPSGVNLVQFGYKIVPSPGSPVAIASPIIQLNFIGTITQSNTIGGLVSVSPVSAVVSMIQPVNASALVSLGSIAILATGKQFDIAQALVAIGALQVTASISSGLFLTSTVTVGPAAGSASIASSTNASALLTVVPHGGAIINQGLGAAGFATLPVAAVGAIGQNVNATATTTFALTANVSSTQTIVAASALGRISPITASGGLAAANSSNIHIGLSAWNSNTVYTAGQRVAATFNGVTNAYQANSSGTSSSTAPNGTGTSFPDGTLTWKFLSHVDFSDLNSWSQSIPATLTQPVVGLLWNNGPITTTAGTPFLTLGSSATPRSTSAVNNITLRAAPGEGIRDALVGGTTALNFNATKGVAFVLPAGTGGVNYFDLYDSNIVFDGLQFQDPTATSGSTILQQNNTCAAFTVSNCIVDGYGQAGGAVIIQGGTGAFEMINTLVVDRTAAATDYAASIIVQSTTNRIVNCTIVALNNPGSMASAILANSAASVIENSIITGYSNSIGGAGGPIAPADHCLFDTATPGVGGVDNGNNLFNKPAANQFVSVTNDFRLKVGSDAINAGVTATADIPTADDIAKTHRPHGLAWDIGCWEA